MMEESAVVFDPSIALGDATVQQLQLELLRRTVHNALDGQKVVSDLLANQDLWEAVLLDRLYVWGKERLPLGGLIKLRDLPHNDWNADTLYVLTERGEKAVQLVALVRRWAGEVVLYDDPKDVAHSLGSGRDEHAILTVWWD